MRPCSDPTVPEVLVPKRQPIPTLDLFAYQLWLEAQPHPAVDQMLDLSHEHSAQLRTNADGGRLRTNGAAAYGRPQAMGTADAR